MSVPSPSEAQATFAATLVDEWVSLGMRDAVVCPGSRSTPLTLAFGARDDLRVHIRLDERSAAFFAIGRSIATSRPVAVVVTSGTAAAELHAAVAEADLAQVSLVVVSADRPPELHGVGAPQTMDQAHLYGAMVRRNVNIGHIAWSERDSWRSVAAGLYQDAHDGPVHLNVSFVEPLVAGAWELPEPVRTTSTTPVVKPSSIRIDEPRVLVVAGEGADDAALAVAARSHWPVVGDATRRDVIAHADPILRDAGVARALRPDVVIRLGGLPASKVLAQRLREWESRVVALRDRRIVADPDRIVSDVVDSIEGAESDRSYLDQWLRAEDAVEAVLEEHATSSPRLDEIMVARQVVEVANSLNVSLVIGSSMPFRDVEWWAPRRTVPTFANRGVNGIDGVVSTGCGVASTQRGIVLVGDLTFLHDAGSLADGVGEHGGRCVIVVNDNGGGGIFSFLSQAEVLDAERFSRLFTTPRRHDLVAIARAYGHAACRVESLDELRHALDDGLARDGVSVVVAQVPDVSDNVAVHDRANEAVIAALRGVVT